MAPKRPPDDSVCRNRKASFRYEILEKVECGIVLRGTEVKSLRERNVSIEESYARIDDNEVWLIGCHVAPYGHAHGANHDPLRRRKLLLHKTQVAKLQAAVERQGLTLIPLRVYFNDRGLAKVTLGLVRGKKVADKRQALKARQHAREMERATRRRR